MFQTFQNNTVIDVVGATFDISKLLRGCRQRATVLDRDVRYHPPPPPPPPPPPEEPPPENPLDDELLGGVNALRLVVAKSFKDEARTAPLKADQLPPYHSGGCS
jgi:hypothetical protein